MSTQLYKYTKGVGDALMAGGFVIALMPLGGLPVRERLVSCVETDSFGAVVRSAMSFFKFGVTNCIEHRAMPLGGDTINNCYETLENTVGEKLAPWAVATIGVAIVALGHSVKSLGQKLEGRVTPIEVKEKPAT